MIKNKSSGLFLELSGHSIKVIRTNSFTPPIVIEEICEYDPSNEAEAKEFIHAMMGTKKGQFSRALCCIYPPSRFVRKVTLENALRAKEPNFFPNYIREQLQIDPSNYKIAILNAKNGEMYNPAGIIQKDLIFCGALSHELSDLQNQLLSYGVYPERVEIASLSILGGLTRYSTIDKSPTLALEITPNSASVYIVKDDHLDLSRPLAYGLNSMVPLIQKQLGLKDESSAQKLLYANTFDFTEKGPVLLNKLIRELQASIGFYEVQTGQTLETFFLSPLPPNLDWINQTLVQFLGMNVFSPNIAKWLASFQITASEHVDLSKLDYHWFGPVSLLTSITPPPVISEKTSAKKK
ncbi:MAG: hypothetical protein COZ46_05270 [Verrucomicrobia bacterium CG_4_10_14_3_um_filter_43_23]|nr:MAG: hypothetical protein COX01_08345 [Verrucomicrobia bacterium CG22_combo_CG10-13_8_21_14_all_43_17]PIX58188.1 MAG: hypothetical protein COZ46_05270 [Verrucomicrobia bacterium CG_4_10_14_3_um_filter_43_23]PIY60841.1 MAG: hypothetical protein COY94_08365 [Verrucomicrobia bacterium CG_4_10_14_0_8_um_filter_43_34]PJA44331.1 MAG: hypothetical protein CO175_03330 [Verrucomicrobia bacterium CG_4_9_14_3_um_filter_43_20]